MTFGAAAGLGKLIAEISRRVHEAVTKKGRPDGRPLAVANACSSLFMPVNIGVQTAPQVDAAAATTLIACTSQ